MKIDHIFTTPVAIDYLDVDNLSLESFCRSQIAKNAPVSSNQSDKLDLTAPELQDLFNEIESRINHVWVELGMRNDLRLKINRAWTTLNNSSEIDLAHCHPDSIFTAVYYVKGTGTPDNGNLILISPVTSLQHVIFPSFVKHKNSTNSWNCAVSPEPGLLVMFPAWIIHQVQQNRSSEDRLSIALDITLA